VLIIDWTDESGSDTVLYLGFGGLLGGYIYGIMDAADAARDHNARVRATGASFRVVPAPSGVGAAVVLAVR
jgi:hypothetical protein